MKSQRSCSSTRIFFLAALVLQLLVTKSGRAASFINTGAVNTPRWFHQATLLPNGKVLITGGVNGGSGTELYDPGTGRWAEASAMSTDRWLHTATLLPNGKVLVVGGLSSGITVPSAELYDPTSGTWSPTGPMGTARIAHVATLLPNGKVLVAGGVKYDAGIYTAYASAEMYDPATGAWTATGAMSIGRRYHTATLLTNGTVLVAGGQTLIPPYSSLFENLASAEVYDSATGTWTATGSMNTNRVAHTMTLLPNGKVLVTGGFEYIYLSAELYDPTAGVWTLANPMQRDRFNHTATLLPNGKVLVVGGRDQFSEALRTTELYDPAMNAWTQTQPLAETRYYQTATSLTNGKVLVACGFHMDSSIYSTELYQPDPTVRLLSGGDLELSFQGVPGTNYALQRAFSPLSPVWISQATNPAGPGSTLIFTNSPDPNTNNFWRIRPAL